MALQMAIVRQAKPAGGATGTQDYTVSGIGTPVGAIFVMGRSTTDGSYTANGGTCFGVTDGTDTYIMATLSRDGQVATRTYERCTDAYCVGSLNPATGDWFDTAIFDSWITDGIRIDWTVSGAGLRLVTCYLFYGTNATAQAVGFSNDSISYNESPAIAFTPLCGVFGTLENFLTPPPFDDTLYQECDIGIGFYAASNDGAVTQVGASINEGDNLADGSPTCHIEDGYAINFNSSGAGISRGALSFDGTKFTTTFDIPAICGLVLGDTTTNATAKAFIIDTPTAIGVASVTSAGFTPAGAMVIGTHGEALNTLYNDANAGTFSLSGFSATTAYANNLVIEDGVATTNTADMSNDVAINTDNDDQTAGVRATLTGFHDRGMFLNYTDVTTNAKKHAVLCWGVQNRRVRIQDNVRILDNVRII